VHVLQFFELRQERSGFRSVAAVFFEPRDPLTLLDYVLCALLNVRFCLSQVSLRHLSADGEIYEEALSPASTSSIGDHRRLRRVTEQAGSSQCPKVHQSAPLLACLQSEPSPRLAKTDLKFCCHYCCNFRARSTSFAKNADQWGGDLDLHQNPTCHANSGAKAHMQTLNRDHGLIC
jgi:hypothetical protein